MPKPHDFLFAEQWDGSVLQAKEIYTENWQWLKGIGFYENKLSKLFDDGTDIQVDDFDVDAELLQKTWKQSTLHQTKKLPESS